VKTRIKKQKGFALITALLIIFALSVIGIVAVNSSVVENLITTNTKVSKQAFFLAEAGAEEARELLRQRIMDQGSSLAAQINLVKGADGVLGTADDLPLISNTLGAGSYSVKLTNDRGLTQSQLDSQGIITLTSTGFGPMNSRAVVKQEVQAVNNPPRTVRHRAFGVGIVTDRNLTINGQSEIDADSDIGSGTHSNGNTVINGSGTITGIVSAHGTITMNGNWNGVTQNAGVDTIDVPSISEAEFNRLRTIAQASGFYYNGSYTHNTNGNLGNQIIFVDGNLTINSHVFNGTLVATGSVTVNGSSQIDGSTINTAIFSGGNIVMNGSSDSYGAFWSNGSFVQNGRSRVIGSIVSRGDITRNGHFKFTYNGNIVNDNLPTVTVPGTISYRVLGWKQG
jgi:Tfp pilus assembly protein PilX